MANGALQDRARTARYSHGLNHKSEVWAIRGSKESRDVTRRGDIAGLLYAERNPYMVPHSRISSAPVRIRTRRRRPVAGDTDDGGAYDCDNCEATKG